jgi:hypothetical protein
MKCADRVLRRHAELCSYFSSRSTDRSAELKKVLGCNQQLACAALIRTAVLHLR